jgi:hypothetical protein
MTPLNLYQMYYSPMKNSNFAAVTVGRKNFQFDVKLLNSNLILTSIA